MRRTLVVMVLALCGVVLAGGLVGGAAAGGGGTAVDAAPASVGGPTFGGADAGSTATADLVCEFPFEVEDGSGTNVTVDEEPEEVVVLAPSNAQHMWGIGAEERVTGMPVNQFTAYLEGSEERTNVVGDDGVPIVEEVVGLEPDLVIAADIIDADTIESLRDAGLSVYHSPTMTSPDDMLVEVETVGQLVGECEGASATVEETRETFEAIESATADEDAPTVFYDLGFPFTVGEGTLEHQLITMAGGDNVATVADEPGYFEISEEVIAEEDPEWLIVSEAMGVPDVTAIRESTAVEEDQIIEVNPNFISQHGPRNVVPLQQFAEAFHPDAMAALEEADDADDAEAADDADDAAPADDADDTEPADDTADDADDAPPADADDTEPADDGFGPGFAIGAALAGLVGLALLARIQQ